jgi:hypothetical protein
MLHGSLLTCVSVFVVLARNRTHPQPQVQFTTNVAGRGGGALHLDFGATATLDGDANVMTGNTLTDTGDSIGGAFLLGDGTTLTIRGKLTATANAATSGVSVAFGGFAFLATNATLQIFCPGDVSLASNLPDAIAAFGDLSSGQGELLCASARVCRGGGMCCLDRQQSCVHMPEAGGLAAGA